MSVLVPPPRPVREDPQALINAARRRTRLRRLRAAVGVVLLLGAGVLAFFASPGGSSGIVAETAGQPFVDVKAFRHGGELAFISRGSLWVLDGAAGTLRKVASTTYAKGFKSVGDIHANPTQVPEATPVVPGSPTFSHDGRWLAYLVAPQTAEGSPSQLWIANAGGTDAHEVANLAVAALVGWSPTWDVLAVIAEANGWYGNHQQGQLPVQLELVSARGAVRRLLALSTSPTRPGQIESAAWSPSGSEIAVSVTNAPGSGVRAYPVGGGTPTTWFSIGPKQSLPSSACGTPGRRCNEVIADLAGWWPGWGIGFWVFADGMTHNNDNTSLELLTAPGARPRLIAHTLSDGDDAVAAGPGGALALVASPSAGRVYSQGKTVETCTRSTLTCADLPDDTVWSAKTPKLRCLGACGQAHSPPPGTPGSAVSLEPAWSPNGSQLAYVLAPTTPTDLQTPAWYAAHELFVWNQRTDSTRELAGISGDSVPTWSRNGRDLLYVSGNGLWLAPARGGRPVEIERPLFPESEWNQLPLSLSYFGQIDWTGQFSWSSP